MYRTDFPHIYYAGSTILDHTTPNYAVYDIDKINKYSIPEEASGDYHVFIYSMIVAYIITPLALLPYFKAKATWILINTLLYIAAVAISLRIRGASGRWFAYPLAISCLWTPFIENLRYAQGNAILLFLVTVAVLASTKNRPIYSGILLAVAALFKLFPIGIAMVMGIKNWRIFVSCAVVFCAAFLVPDSLKWFSGIKNMPQDTYSYTFLWLKQFGSLWFVVYTTTIAGITALVVYRADNANYPLIASISIPAVYLAMPVLEYHHATVLIFTYLHILFSSNSNRLLAAGTLLSFILIGAAYIFIKYMSPLVTIFYSVGLFLLWASLIRRFFLLDSKRSGGVY